MAIQMDIKRMVRANVALARWVLDAVHRNMAYDQFSVNRLRAIGHISTRYSSDNSALAIRAMVAIEAGSYFLGRVAFGQKVARESVPR